MPWLDETTCRPGASLRRMFTSAEAAIIKRFINSFQVRTWNGREPYIDRSNVLGEYTIYIPRSGGSGPPFPWEKLSFGHTIIRDGNSTSVRINTGSIRRHGFAPWTLDGNDESRTVSLSGQTEIVFLNILKSTGLVLVDHQSTEPLTSGSEIKIPLVRLVGEIIVPDEGDSYLSYALDWIYNMGEVHFDTPIR